MAQIPITVPVLTDNETDIIRESIQKIKGILADKFINLEPADRQRFGSISEQNKLVVNKVKDYHENMPHLSDPKLNWKSFHENFTTRKNYAALKNLFNELNELCNDPRTLVDYVLFGQAVKDYKWTKYNAEDDGGGTAGFEAKYNDLKQFFTHVSGDSKESDKEDAVDPAQ